MLPPLLMPGRLNTLLLPNVLRLMLPLRKLSTLITSLPMLELMLKLPLPVLLPLTTTLLSKEPPPRPGLTMPGMLMPSLLTKEMMPSLPVTSSSPLKNAKLPPLMLSTPISITPTVLGMLPPRYQLCTMPTTTWVTVRVTPAGVSTDGSEDPVFLNS